MNKFLVLATFSFMSISLANPLPTEKLHDAEIKQQVVGTWIVDMPPIKGTVTILSGGYFLSQGEIILSNDTIKISYEGTWRIDGGVLIEKITKSNTKLLPVGHISRDKIIHVNGKELVYETESGKIVTRERSK